MNRPVELESALRSVRAGTAQPYQLIVSDDGDGSARAVAERFGATYQEGPRRGLGPNRNSCLALATGSQIAFIDDDVTVSDTFVARASVPVDPHTVVTGWELNYKTAEPRKVTPHNADFLGFQRVPPNGQYRAIVINATVFPAGLFDRAQFDERIRYGYEEIDMARQALSLGYRIGYDNELWVRHRPSSVNRESYADRMAASRIYLTYRAYRYYERRPAKAIAFAIASSAHHVGHSLRTGRGLAPGLAAISTARGYLRASREGAVHQGVVRTRQA